MQVFPPKADALLSRAGVEVSEDAPARLDGVPVCSSGGEGTQKRPMQVQIQRNGVSRLSKGLYTGADA